MHLFDGDNWQVSPQQRQDWPALVGLTLLGGVVGPLALVLGLARLPAASSSLLLNLEAVFTLTIAMAVGREHLGKRGLLSAALTLAWAIDNNLSQRLSLRNPIQIASLKAVGASLPMLSLALLLGEAFPSRPVISVLLGIGALFSLLVLREQHSHGHHHPPLRHNHRHHHDPAHPDLHTPHGIPRCRQQHPEECRALRPSVARNREHIRWGAI